MTIDFRMLAKWNQSLEKWISAKGQWWAEHPRRDVVNTQWPSSSLFCQSVEMKTRWVEGIDIREVEEWGQSKE